MASKLSSQLVPLISSGQSAKWHQMVSARALQRTLLGYPDWAYLNEEVWDKISIIWRLAQQRFSCFIGQILFRQIRYNRDYENITFYNLADEEDMKKNSPQDPKPPLHYMMGKKMHLILNDPRFSHTGCDEKLLTIIIFDIYSVKKYKL